MNSSFILNLRLESLVPARPSTKKERQPKPEHQKSHWKGTSGGPKPTVAKVNGLRAADDNASKTSTPTDSGTSEDESSSEEESEYEEAEMPPIQDVSEVSFTSILSFSRLPIGLHSCWYTLTDLLAIKIGQF